MIYVDELKASGNHRWCHAMADTPRELRRLPSRLRAVVKVDARGQHLDLSEHQRALALEHGAVEWQT